MKTEHLDILDLLAIEGTYNDKSLWVDRISQRDLYSIASWLLMNLISENSQVEHKRSQLRDMLNYYYDQKSFYNNTAPWSTKSKWFVANAVINLWDYRRVENDPRYVC